MDNGEMVKFICIIKLGRREGLGIEVYANQDKYEGQWLNGWRSGKGKYSFSDGGYFEGEWEHDQYHGQGILVNYFVRILGYQRIGDLCWNFFAWL